MFSAPSFSQSQCRPRAGMCHGKASMPVFSARMHCPSKISADNVQIERNASNIGRAAAALGNSSLPHARGHIAACAWGCVTGRPACPFFPRACITHQRFLPINVQVERNASNMGRAAAALGNPPLPHVQGHSAACAWGCVTGRPACPFFPRTCIAHQRFLPIMYRSNGMPPTRGARRRL